MTWLTAKQYRFVTGATQRGSHVEHGMLTIPERMTSPQLFLLVLMVFVLFLLLTYMSSHC